MKKLNRNNLKLISSELEGDLYSCYSELEEKNKPLLFIRDHITTGFHPAAIAYGLNKKLTVNDICFNHYDEFIHKPYIWVYNYAKSYSSKDYHKASNFAKSLLVSLELNKIGNVDILGEGLGGIVAMYASLSSKVDKVLAIHPPILGAPIADIDLLREKAKTFRQRLILMALNQIIDSCYGYNIENMNGYSDINKRCRLEKIKVVGSSIVGYEKNNNLEQLLSELIYDCTGIGNDGVSLWDQEMLTRMGFDVVNDDVPVSHFKMLKNSDYEKEQYKRLILK